MWRKVSCEQPLNTSQSILRLRGSLNQTRRFFYLLRKYALTAERESGPYSRTWSRNRFGPSYPSWQRDTTRRRPPELWEELSFLHEPPRPWNPLAGRMGFGKAKSAAVSAASTSAWWDLENPREVTADSRQLVLISAAGLQG